MRSEVTAEVLVKVAARLDARALSYLHGRWYIVYNSNTQTGLSDGDLLLAILNKAAEMGYERDQHRRKSGRIQLFFVFGKYDPDGIKGYGESHNGNELEAALLAFAQLPESP